MISSIAAGTYYKFTDMFYPTISCQVLERSPTSYSTNTHELENPTHFKRKRQNGSLSSETSHLKHYFLV